VAPPHILLAGGGHAQLAVLADWIRHGRPPCEAWLVSPARYLRYSGMVPGIISKDYCRDDGLIDLAALASSAGTVFIEQALVALDADRRHAVLDDGHVLAFDVCSLDTGGVGQAASVLGPDPRLVDIRPIENFLAWHARIDRHSGKTQSVAVIGGGAGGVELAFALRNMDGPEHSPAVHLITGTPGLLPGHAALARRYARAELDRQKIAIHECDAHIADGKLHAGGELLEPVDHIVAAIGSAAPPWRQRGLCHG
jgi:NADH dehydrogenase FAD-containing subunit